MKRGVIKAVFLCAAVSMLGGSCLKSTKFRGMKEADLTSAGKEESLYSDSYQKSYLVAVGIDKYRNVDLLRHAVSDAEAIVASFKARGFEVQEIYNESATKQKIMDALQAVVSNAGENDRVVFFFAGHGIDMPAKDGSIKGFLIPVDGKPENKETLIPMSWLQIDLIADDNVKVKHALFILDACSSGMIAARSSIRVDRSVRNYISELLKRKARQVITAGTGDQQVLDGGYRGHSIFAGLILQGLENNLADINNDYHITATELGLFLSQQVFVRSKGVQKPDFAKLIGTRGGEVIVKFPNEKEKSVLRKRETTPKALMAELVLNVPSCIVDVAIYSTDNELVVEKKKVRMGVRIPDIPAGDYYVVIRPRDNKYVSVKLILGLYGTVARQVELPLRLHNMNVPLGL